MADLPKRKLGRTGLQVTMLGYGAMELRGAPRARDITDGQAETILNAVLDGGINYIDTSIDYGLSEERIGRYISHRRDSYYLASKCGCLVGAPPAPRGQRGPHLFTRENIVAGVEQSLARMKTDHLDVVQFHISPSRRTLEDNGAVEALLDLKAAGKVRFIGMSGTLPHLRDHIAMGVFDVFQIPYQPLKGSMKRRYSKRQLPGRALSSAAAPRRALRRQGSSPACNGSGGSERGSTTFSIGQRLSSSFSVSRSATRICIRPSSAPSIQRIFRAISTLCRKGRSRRVSMQRRSAGLPKPALCRRCRRAAQQAALRVPCRLAL
jgi:aldo/keto reductase family protein